MNVALDIHIRLMILLLLSLGLNKIGETESLANKHGFCGLDSLQGQNKVSWHTITRFVWVLMQGFTRVLTMKNCPGYMVLRFKQQQTFEYLRQRRYKCEPLPVMCIF